VQEEYPQVEFPSKWQVDRGSKLYSIKDFGHKILGIFALFDRLTPDIIKQSNDKEIEQWYLL